VIATLLLLAVRLDAQTRPERLPAPDVPVEQLPEPGPQPERPVPRPAFLKPREVSQPGGDLQLGPPAEIDGPQRLPPPETDVLPEEIVPGRPGGDEVLFPDSPIGDLLSDDELYYEEGPQKLSPYKSGFFQKLSLSAAWFGNSNDPRDLGGTEIETFLTVALPAPIKEWPMLITPGYNLSLIEGATVTDVPSRLYLAYVDFTWLPEIVHRYRLLLSLTPSVFGDPDVNEFRFTGKALVVYDWVPDRLQFVAGVLYLNRDNIRVLPAGGLIWSPTDDYRFELLFPKPKLAVRTGIGTGFEDWIFTTAEFGGNTWPVLRANGEEDALTYIDYRLLVGYERKIDGGAGYRLEAGYVFGRMLEFSSGIGDFDPQSTIVLRGGIVF
jgi:hypothetical protein